MRAAVLEAYGEPLGDVLERHPSRHEALGLERRRLDRLDRERFAAMSEYETRGIGITSF